jgi:hypothetical protein
VTDKDAGLQAYLRTLAAFYTDTLKLVDSLKNYKVADLNFEIMLDQLFLEYRNEYPIYSSLLITPKLYKY